MKRSLSSLSLITILIPKDLIPEKQEFMHGKRRVLTTMAVFSFAVSGAQAQSSRSWGTAPIEWLVSASDANGGNLRAVRVAKHRGYDRVVFEFDGKILPK